jgi:HPt (histidine-containing phosphotransfer) domain-containing protein
MIDERRDLPGQAPVDGWSPVLDESVFRELCAHLSAAEAREFVWLCIVDIELRLTDIASHRAAGDLESVAGIAHGIAREAAKLGAVRVHVLALRLETSCRSGSIGTYSLIGELSDAWTEAGDTMCAWLGQQAPFLADAQGH